MTIRSVEVIKKMPDPRNMVWCPYCEYRLTDSFTARKKLGMHVGSEHYTKVIFPIGVEPDDLDKSSGTKKEKESE